MESFRSSWSGLDCQFRLADRETNACRNTEESHANLAGPKSSLGLEDEPYHAVAETTRAAKSTGDSDEAKALSTLEALNRAANAGLGLAPMCQKPPAQPKQPAPRWWAAKAPKECADKAGIENDGFSPRAWPTRPKASVVQNPGPHQRVKCL